MWAAVPSSGSGRGRCPATTAAEYATRSVDRAVNENAKTAIRLALFTETEFAWRVVRSVVPGVGEPALLDARFEAREARPRVGGHDAKNQASQDQKREQDRLSVLAHGSSIDPLQQNGATMIRGLATVVLIGLVAACGPTCGGSTSTGQSSSIHLVFTGPAPGTLTAGGVDCRVFGGKQFNASITGKLGDRDVLFNVQVLSSYKGPATYAIGTTLDGEANLRLQIGDWVGSSPPNAGQLILTDSRSGVVDANLGDFEHVTGNFRCAEVKQG